MSIEYVEKIKNLKGDELAEFNENSIINFILNSWIKIFLETNDEVSNDRLFKIPYDLLELSIIKEGLSTRNYRIIKDYISFIVNNIKSEFEKQELKEKHQEEIKKKEELIKDLSEISKNLSDNRVEKVNLQKIYLDNKEKFENWIRSFNWVNDTKTRHINKNRSIFIENDIKTISQYYALTQREEVSTIYQFRKFIEFCKWFDLLSFDHIGIILTNIKSKSNGQEQNYDDYLPSFEEMKESLNIIREVIKTPLKEVRTREPISEIHLLLYQLSIESGVRWMSIQREIFENFDKSKLQFFGDVAVYNIKKDKKKTLDNKKGIFLFCRTKTIKRIIEFYEQDKELFLTKILHDFKRSLQERCNNQLVFFKHHRNYGKSLMNSLNIDHFKSEFIQSRLEKDIGWKNYSDKLTPSVEAYKLTLPHWKKLIDEE